MQSVSKNALKEYLSKEDLLFQLNSIKADKLPFLDGIAYKKLFVLENGPLGLYAEGYCKIPATIGGLLGTCQEGKSLNILFARGLYNCNEGRKWFLPKEEEK